MPNHRFCLTNIKNFFKFILNTINKKLRFFKIILKKNYKF